MYPLFSPQSLIAEGTANYGIEVAFPDDERRRFERDVLFPAAGLDASQVDEFYEVMALVEKLSYAGNEAARRYRNGEIDAAAAAKWHETYALMSPERAAQRVRFIDQYGAYVINYNLGKDLVARVSRAARRSRSRGALERVRAADLVAAAAVGARGVSRACSRLSRPRRRRSRSPRRAASWRNRSRCRSRTSSCAATGSAACTIAR